MTLSGSHRLNKDGRAAISIIGHTERSGDKKLDDYDLRYSPVYRSLSEVVTDKVMEEVADPLIKLPPVSKDLKDLARSAVRRGLEKSSDAPVHCTGAADQEADGLKATCKAALKTKSGGATR